MSLFVVVGRSLVLFDVLWCLVIVRWGVCVVCFCWLFVFVCCLMCSMFCLLFVVCVMFVVASCPLYYVCCVLVV